MFSDPILLKLGVVADQCKVNTKVFVKCKHWYIEIVLKQLNTK